MAVSLNIEKNLYAANKMIKINLFCYRLKNNSNIK